jgi:aminoglycoside phosphotransferase (APT) family kinase protein
MTPELRVSSTAKPHGADAEGVADIGEVARPRRARPRSLRQMGPDLETLANELAPRFPEVQPVAPLTVLGSGFGNLVVETASGVVFRVARDETTGERFRLERSLLTELARSLRLALPVPKWQAFDLSSAPHGISGHRKLGGNPLAGTQLSGAPAQALAEQIAEFLFDLHGVQPTGLDTPLRIVSPQQRLTSEFHTCVRAALVPHVAGDELRVLDTWFADASAQLGVSGQLVVTHGDLWFENLLVQPGPRLSGVLDWSAVALSVPARDLAPLTYNGDEFLAGTSRAYAEATGRDAEELKAQAGMFLLLRELTGLRWAELHHPSELPDAVGKVVALLRQRSSRSSST